ncbi:hypothetical protein [uncultured Desulfovibrio sp.]|uniref:hypothetical protein n=1 Tax=uncultured Desulfovibrio sp. TaxID=167968 RepID=UPI0028057E03|nr:hypothetical protein [uncultured Desulfovibrio sp.]
MDAAQLIFLLGSEGGGVYTVARALRGSGLNVGEPRPELANRAIVRHQPDHGHLWQWQALRRYFGEFGLPPIAEIPADLLSPEARAYYAGTFARCLGQSLAVGAPFVYADHMGALALPLLVEAAGMLGVSWAAWFFFSHPAGEVARLRQERGVPAPLAEFVWRNVAAAAIVHSHEGLRCVDMDALSPAVWHGVYAEITGTEAPPPPPLPAPSAPPAGERLSPGTLRLHAALTDYAAGRTSWAVLRETALAARHAQEAQNGWQYVDCLDCGELDAQARRLLAHARAVAEEAAATDAPDAGAATEAPLEMAERELLCQRQEFATRLFLHNQSLRIRCQNALEDLRQRHARELQALKETARRRCKRRKERLRRLLEKARIQ